jgi:hypothetical protein
MSTIKLFNKALKGSEVDYNNLQQLGLKIGYLVHPECATNEVKEFLESQKIDFTSTFYQKWKDVTSKNRLELFVDQAIHYMSTYGTDFEGEPALPEKTAEMPEFKNFKTILPVTKEEVGKRCNDMLSSGIALDQKTIEMILSILKQIDYPLDIDIIKNKEALVIIADKKGILPTNPVETLRFLVYKATGKSLLIKDKETIEKIKESNLDLSSYKLNYESLSEIFLRFKPLFLAFKKANSKNIALINKLRKLANKNHKPIKKGYFETLLTDFTGLGKLPEKLKEINNFKKITLLEAIKVKQAKNDINVFPIRNGKIWLDKEPRKKTNKDTLDLIYSIIYQSLVDSLKEKATTIKLPDGVDLTVPKSEKSFVGNYPLGTSFDLSYSNAIVGINWKEKDGARDLDLSSTSIDGEKIGWNSDFYNEEKTVIYSGDITSANPEATELLYASSGFKPLIIKVNLYSGDINSRFKFFIAKEKINNLKANYMVNPNNILFNNEMKMESREQSLGIITGDKFVIAKFRTGKKVVSGKSITNKYIDYTLNTLDCYVNMQKVLKEAGFEFVEDNAEIDLTNLSKDTLIELFSTH